MASAILRIIENQIRTWDSLAQTRRTEVQGLPGTPPRIRPCITIARMIGSGGWEIAQLLKPRLGWEVFDREIVEVIIRQGRFREAITSSLDEHDRSSVELWVDGLLHGLIVDKGDYHRALVKVLTSISMHGHAILIGRGGNFILDRDRTLNVRFVAPRSFRVEMISRSQGMPLSRAAALVKQTDHERAAFITHNFHARIDDPTAYDLTINMAGFTQEAAADAIVQALRLKFGGRDDVEL